MAKSEKKGQNSPNPAGEPTPNGGPKADQSSRLLIPPPNVIDAVLSLPMSQAKELIAAEVGKARPGLVVETAHEILEGLTDGIPGWNEDQTAFGLLYFEGVQAKFASPKARTAMRPHDDPETQSYIHQITTKYIEGFGSHRFISSPNFRELCPPMLTVGETLAPAIKLEYEGERKGLWTSMYRSFVRAGYAHPNMKPEIGTRANQIRLIIGEPESYRGNLA